MLAMVIKQKTFRQFHYQLLRGNFETIFIFVTRLQYQCPTNIVLPDRCDHAQQSI